MAGPNAATNFLSPEDYAQLLRQAEMEDRAGLAMNQAPRHWTQALAGALNQGLGGYRAAQAREQNQATQADANAQIAALLQGNGDVAAAMANPRSAPFVQQYQLTAPQREREAARFAREKSQWGTEDKLNALKIQQAEMAAKADQRRMAQRDELMKLFTAPSPSVPQQQPQPRPPVAPGGQVGPQGPEAPPSRFNFGQEGMGLPQQPAAGPGGVVSPNAPIGERLAAMPEPESSSARPMATESPTEAVATGPQQGASLQEQIQAMSPVARQRAAMLVSAGKVDEAFELVMEQSSSRRLGGYKDEKQKFDVETKARTEFQKVTQDFRTVRDSLTVVRSAAENPSPAGDLSMIYAYMRMLDPGSVVRESEFAMAANAGSLPTRWQNLANKALSGTFTPKTRADFLARAEKIYMSRQKNYSKTEKQYKEFAKRKGLDPRNIIFDFRIAEDEQGLGQSQPAAESQDYSKMSDDEIMKRLGVAR